MMSGGVEGEALSLVDGEEVKLLKGIERLIGRKIPQRDVEGFDFNAPLPAQERDERAARPPRKPGGQPSSRNSQAKRRGGGGGGERAGQPGKPRRRRRASGGGGNRPAR